MTARQHTGIRSKIRKKSLKPPPRTLLSSNIAFSKIFYRNLLHLLLKERGTLEHFRCKETRCFSCLLWEAESTSLALEKDIDWSHKLGAISIEHWNCGRKILLQVSCFIFTINKLFFLTLSTSHVQYFFHQQHHSISITFAKQSHSTISFHHSIAPSSIIIHHIHPNKKIQHIKKKHG